MEYLRRHLFCFCHSVSDINRPYTLFRCFWNFLSPILRQNFTCAVWWIFRLRFVTFIATHISFSWMMVSFVFIDDHLYSKFCLVREKFWLVEMGSRVRELPWDDVKIQSSVRIFVSIEKRQGRTVKERLQQIIKLFWFSRVKKFSLRYSSSSHISQGIIGTRGHI